VNLLNVDQFRGRHFIASTGNIARIIKLAEGAIRCTWKIKPTQEEIDEFTTWFNLVAGGNLEHTNIVTNNKKLEAEALQKFLQKVKSNA
jgi:hypothetical protein